MGLPRSHFLPPIPFLDPSGQIIGHIVKIQKFVKITKIAILAKNSIFHKLVNIARNDDIWPEMGPWDVLEPFCTRIWHFYSYRSNFKIIQKNRFFQIFYLWAHQKLAGRNFYGSRNFEGTSKIRLQYQNLFQNKNAALNSI